ncbi:MAG: ParA family protein, partial [Cyclobacteriaceae bacterium]|nr:ParA family protein [Cyclobacteriaceae bacterium]
KYFKEIIHFRMPEIKPYPINNYVHIIPGNIDLLKIENQLHETTRAQFVLKEMLIPLKKNYDLIFLDCPPSYNLLTINALLSSNLIIIPAKPEVFSIQGIELIRNFAKENSTPYKIVFNQVNSQTLHHKRIIKKEHHDEHVLDQTIRNTIVLAEAFESAQNIFHYKNSSSGAIDFTHLADELLCFL